MKNLFLLLCISLVSMTTALADETTGFSFNWAKTIDSNSSDSPRTLDFSSDGNILALANFGSTSDTEVRFDGTAIGDGAPYEGSSANNNVLFAKITPDGELLWKVISNWGDFSAANSSFAPTADGGAIIVMKMRHTNRDAAGNGILLALNDATGNTTELKWEKPDSCKEDISYRIYASTVYPVDTDNANNIICLKNSSNGFKYISSDCDNLFWTVTSIDRFGNESCPLELNTPDSNEPLICVNKLPEIMEGSSIIINDITGIELFRTQNEPERIIKKLKEGIYKIQITSPDNKIRNITLFITD